MRGLIASHSLIKFYTVKTVLFIFILINEICITLMVVAIGCSTIGLLRRHTSNNFNIHCDNSPISLAVNR